MGFGAVEEDALVENTSGEKKITIAQQDKKGNHIRVEISGVWDRRELNHALRRAVNQARKPRRK